MAGLSGLPHGTRGARDARNALLAHRSSGTHLTIAGRALGTWGPGETIFSCNADTNVPLFTFGPGQSSHSWHALPSFPADLARESG